MSIKLNNYRIVKVDKRNWTFERLNKKNKWVQVGGYYATLDSTCKELKDFIIQENVDSDIDAKQLIEILTEIQITYHTIQIIGE